MSDSFLSRFLSTISAETLPNADDLKLIANALIQMHGYGVSFKTAFGLADNRGRKPKTPKNTLQSDSFQSMGKGFLGNPLFLNRFLSKVDQEQQPRREDLQQVANALIKIRDNGESLKSAFGIIEKTGHKQLDITQIPFNELVSHENWIIYYAYEKYIKTETDTETCELISESLLVKKIIKGEIKNRRYSSRQIQRIIAETKTCFEIYATPIKIKQRETWRCYFSSKKHIRGKSILDTIEAISSDTQRDWWEICLKLAGLYEEVVIKKKYAPITRGTRDYPKRITKCVESDLQAIYEIVTSVHAISPIDSVMVKRIYEYLIKTKNHCDAIEIISKQKRLAPIVIECLLKVV